MNYSERDSFLRRLLSPLILVLLLAAGSAVTTAQQEGRQAVDPTLQAQADQANMEARALAEKGEWPGALEKFRAASELYRRAQDKKGEAKALGNMALAYSYMEDQQKALEYYARALELARAAGDSAGEARTLENMATAYVEVKEYQKALDSLGKALPIERANSNRHGEAAALVLTAHVYEQVNELGKALDHYLQALPLLHAGDDRRREAFALMAAGSLYVSLKEPQKALDLLAQALPLWQALGDKANEAATRTLAAGSYHELSDNRRALESFKLALTLWQSLKNRQREAGLWQAAGAVSGNLGQYREELLAYNQALAIWRDLGVEAKQAEMINLLGLYYNRLGDHRKAIDYFNQALALWRSARQPEGEAETLRQLGSTYYYLDQNREALEHFTKARSLWQAAGNLKEEALAVNDIGKAYMELGDYQKASDHFNQALPLWQKLGETYYLAYTLRQLGNLYTRAGDRQKARSYLDQVVQLGEKLDDPAFKAILLSQTGLVYNMLGDYQRAVEYNEQALALHRKMYNLPAEADALAGIGSAYEGRNDLARALDFYLQAIKIKEGLRSDARIEELKTGLAGQAADAYERAVSLHMRLKQPALAFDLSERARARTFLDQLSNARLDIRKGSDAQLIAEEQQLRLELASLERKLREESVKPGPQQSAGAVTALAGRLAAGQKQYEDLLTRIKLANPEYAAQVTVTTRTLPEVQKLLDRETTLLSYFVMHDRTLAFVVTPDSFQAVELPLKEQDLNAAVEAFRLFPSLDAPPDSELRRLYDSLITPLRPYLKSAVVGIVPHGALHYLPFAALMSGEGRYFGDEHTLFYLPSSSVLSSVRQKGKSGAAMTMLALSNSRPDKLPPLPYADSEAQTIAKLFNAQPLLGGAATETAFRAHAGQYTLLHLAAHGQLNVDSPSLSRIVLAPDADNPDGSLEVQEVYGLDLKHGELVVLSACQTQLGRRSRGDDLVGLNRAFIYAGVPTVIASLWNVDDQATGQLMGAFYKHLKEGMSKAAALQAAQRETRARYAHPYYWAAFVLTGDPGK